MKSNQPFSCDWRGRVEKESQCAVKGGNVKWSTIIIDYDIFAFGKAKNFNLLLGSQITN